jgi:hypothetical protein
MRADIAQGTFPQEFPAPVGAQWTFLEDPGRIVLSPFHGWNRRAPA